MTNLEAEAFGIKVVVHAVRSAEDDVTLADELKVYLRTDPSAEPQDEGDAKVSGNEPSDSERRGRSCRDTAPADRRGRDCPRPTEVSRSPPQPFAYEETTRTLCSHRGTHIGIRAASRLNNKKKGKKNKVYLEFVRAVRFSEFENRASEQSGRASL